MSKQLTYGSLFSGIGGFDLGLDRAGMQCAWQVEYDEKARGVLQRHWPDVPRYEDVNHVGRSNLRPVDVICGGFPCQDVSVAGKRAGLAGERSGLWDEYSRIIGELSPTWVVIENVPGLLSSNGGRDMGYILWQLAEFGYGWAYRVLDSQYFGVAQRRRRVFIVGHLGTNGERAGAVLFESESLPWYPAPSREARQGTARDVAASLAASGRVTERAGRQYSDMGDGQAKVVAVRLAQTSSNGCGVNTDGTTGTLDNSGGGAVAFDWQSGGDVRHNVSEKHTSALQANQTPAVMAYGLIGETTPKASRELMPTLRSASDGSGEQHQFVAFAQNTRDEVRKVGGDGDVTGSLGAQAGMHQQTFVAFQSSQSGVRQVDQHATLDSNNGSRRHNGVVHSSGARRLMPVECERLQAFPDGWTAEGVDGPQSDSARYKQLGNAVTVSVAEWIGGRIVACEAVEL